MENSEGSIHKLMNSFGFSRNRANKVCIYLIDRDIAAKIEEWKSNI